MSELEQQDDCLRRRLIAGDETALAEAFSLHRDRLWQMIRFRMDARLHSRIDADDILQEAYLAAAQRIEHYVKKESNSLFVWLRQIATQTMIDVHRRHIGAKMRDARREVSIHAKMPQATSISLAAQLLGRLTSPSQAALRDELAVQLEESLDKMEPIDQEVLALRHFEELSNREVAEVLDIQQKAASIRYIRAIGRLKNILAQIPGFEELQGL
jgi:RNA polymerase sigma-70 factor, ECF subfamily